MQSQRLEEHVNTDSVGLSNGHTFRHNGTRWELGKGIVWSGDYVSGQEYCPYELVKDGEYLGIPNTCTTDRPAPSGQGPQFYLYTGAWPTTSSSAKQVISGTLYTVPAGKAMFAYGYRIHVTEGDSYRIFSVTNDDVVYELSNFTATSTEVLEFSIPTVILPEGETFAIAAVLSEPDPTPVTFSGNWNYTLPNNEGVPGIGSISHANRATTEFRIHKTDDDGGDRSTELNALSTGDIIDGAGMRWTIQATVNFGSWLNITVAPAIQGSPAGVQNFTFETVVETPIPYVQDTGWWTSNPDIQGLLGIDIPFGNIVPDNNQYNIDMLVQDAYVSSDWDIIPLSGAGGGSAGDPTEILLPYVNEGRIAFEHPTDATNLTTLDLYSNDLGDGTTISGPQLAVGRNSNATGAPGSIKWEDELGNIWYIYIDNTGIPRITSTLPVSGADHGWPLYEHLGDGFASHRVIDDVDTIISSLGGSDKSMIVAAMSRSQTTYCYLRGSITWNITGAYTTITDPNFIANGYGAYTRVNGTDNTTTQVQITFDIGSIVPSHGARNKWMPYFLTHVDPTVTVATYYNNIVVETSVDGVAWTLPGGGGWSTSDFYTDSYKGWWSGEFNTPVIDAWRYCRFTLTDRVEDPGYAFKDRILIAECGIMHAGEQFAKHYVNQDRGEVFNPSFFDLPTSDPGVPGQVYQSSGTLMVSL